MKKKIIIGLLITTYAVLGIVIAYSQVITPQDQIDTLNEQIQDYNSSISIEKQKADADNSAMQQALDSIDNLSHKIAVAEYSLNEMLNNAQGVNWDDSSMLNES